MTQSEFHSKEEAEFNINTDQGVPPYDPDRPCTWEEVEKDLYQHETWAMIQPHLQKNMLDDIRSRDEFGRAKYNSPLQPGNGRDSRLDAYQECSDMLVYLKNYCLENVEDLQAGAMYRLSMNVWIRMNIWVHKGGGEGKADEHDAGHADAEG